MRRAKESKRVRTNVIRRGRENQIEFRSLVRIRDLDPTYGHLTSQRRVKATSKAGHTIGCDLVF